MVITHKTFVIKPIIPTDAVLSEVNTKPGCSLPLSVALPRPVMPTSSKCAPVPCATMFPRQRVTNVLLQLRQDPDHSALRQFTSRLSNSPGYICYSLLKVKLALVYLSCNWQEVFHYFFFLKTFNPHHIKRNGYKRGEQLCQTQKFRK